MTDPATTFADRVNTLAPGTPVSVIDKVHAGLQLPQHHMDLPDGYILSMIREATQAAATQPQAKTQYERIVEYAERCWKISTKFGADKMRLFNEARKAIEAEDRAAATNNPAATKAPDQQPQETTLKPEERLRRHNLQSHALKKTREWIAASARAEALPPGRDRMLAQEHASILARQCREMGVELPA